jgi:hypothetical protein
MAYAIEDEKHFLMECPAYQAKGADFESCVMIVKVICESLCVILGNKS